MRVKRRRIRSQIATAGWAAAWGPVLLAIGVSLWACVGAEARTDSGPAPASPTEGRIGAEPQARGSALSPGRSGARVDRAKAVLSSDDWTFRPTVVVRRGTSQGSGTIIASVDGETLVLTAAHVVHEEGPIAVELHRYNLGLERIRPAPGAWPRSLAAALVATDSAADLAILRIEKMAALPYVARLGLGRAEPAPDSVVTSIGIDLGAKLSSWSTRLVEALPFELNDSHDERLFLITAQPPEHGRSGGGLFLTNGELVGVCVGHAELIRGRRLGVFASGESIRQLLLDHNLTAVIARSERRRSRLAGRAPGRPADARAPAVLPSPVTPTRAERVAGGP